MMDERRLEPLSDLPPDLAELDAELADLLIEERPSFAPELEAELAREWVRRPPGRRGRWIRHAASVALVGFGVLGLSVPPARASLVDGVQRILAALQEPAEAVVELPVDEAVPTVGGGSNSAVGGGSGIVDGLNAGSELPPFREGVMTYPTLVDRDAEAEVARRHYPRTLQLAGIGGTVHLALWVDSTGAVDHVQISESSGTVELDWAAQRAARELHFNPLTRNGRPDGTWVEFPFTFTPAEEPIPAAPTVTPGMPDDLDWEVPASWSEAVGVPAPIVMEAQELLASALDTRSEAVSRLGPVEGLLEGEPPAGVNPLQWRNAAAEELQGAMRTDPDNPAPYLALARIRRKQGLRNEARVLFEEGISRASRGSRPISPRLVAELAWEHGRVTRESWLGWRGLGEVASEALPGSQCGILAGTGLGVATAEELIAWNYNCPGVLDGVLRASFEPRTGGEIEADAMLASFRRAVEAYPAHVEANTEILLALADEEAWLAVLNGARRFAWASQGHPNALLLSGLALQRLGRSEEALEEFERAFAELAPAERDRIRDPGVLRLSDDEPAGRTFWRTLDPILATEVNEREIEHYARGAYAQLRFSSLQADASRVWIRYGRPQAVRAVGTGSGIRTEFWDYGRGPDITFHRPMSSANGALTPEAEAYLTDLRDVFPHQYGTRARASYSLPAEVTHFRGRVLGSSEVEFHLPVPVELLRSSADSLELGLYFFASDGRRVDEVRQWIPGDVGEIHRLAPAGPEVQTVVLELWNPATGAAASVRTAAHPATDRGGAAVSGLQLVNVVDGLSPPVERGSRLLPRMDGRIDDDRVGVLFELYDVGPDAAPYRLRFELTDESGARRAVEHRPAGVGSSAVAWTRAPTTVERTVEYSILDVSAVPAGRWELRAVVELDNGRRIERSLGGLTRLLGTVDAPEGAAAWENEWGQTGWQLP